MGFEGLRDWGVRAYQGFQSLGFVGVQVSGYLGSGVSLSIGLKGGFRDWGFRV